MAAADKELSKAKFLSFLSSKKTVVYYGLKEIADFANEEGIEYSTRQLSVYKNRGKLPEPKVMIGDKAGWTREQIVDWIEEVKKKKSQKD